MYLGKRILAVCPARGGSQGIPLKNLALFLGVPLVAHVGRVVKEIAIIDRAVVSTDHPKIASVAVRSGLDAPFVRPEELSGSRVGDVPVLVHALAQLEAMDGVIYDIIVMLQPTSPLRRAEHVLAALEMLVRDKLDSVWTVSETDLKAHPLKQLTISGGQIDYYDPRSQDIVARQELSPTYHKNGVAYAVTRRCLVEAQSIKGARTGALVLAGEFISIDTPWDLELSEYIHARRIAQDNVAVKTVA